MIYLGFLIAFLILLYIAYFYDGSMTQYFDSDLLTDNVVMLTECTDILY